jgi:hypothetical protein
MYASQQLDFVSIGNAGLGLIERRMEEETNRHEQQVRLANEMALMSQHVMMGNGPGAFRSMDNVSLTTQGAGASQRQQRSFVPNPELQNVSAVQTRFPSPDGWHIKCFASPYCLLLICALIQHNSMLTQSLLARCKASSSKTCKTWRTCPQWATSSTTPACWTTPIL